MRRLVRLALVGLAVSGLGAATGWAQRGGHGGFGGHGGGFSGGHVSSSLSRGGGLRGGSGYGARPFGSARPMGFGSQRMGYRARPQAYAHAPMQNNRREYWGGYRGGDRGRSGHYRHDRYRPYYGAAYGAAYPYVWGYPYLLPSPYDEEDPGFLSDSDDTGSGDQGGQGTAAAPEDSELYAPQPYAEPGYGGQGYGEPGYVGQPYGGAPQGYGQQPYAPGAQAYRQPYAAMPTQPAQPAQEAVTLVFKDGRPMEQIHNYVLTPTTLYVQDKGERAIPVSELDLAATAKANREAGVSLGLPATGQ